MVIIHTSYGDIKIQLHEEKAPKTVQNFLQYVQSKHYNGTIFHRVIENFMIQGGGFDTEMNQKSVLPSILCESNNQLSNQLGSVAMARTGDPHSATAQFFINTQENAFLDFTEETPQGWGYCVFGQVIEGMAVIHQIKQAKTTFHQGMQDVPIEPVLINEITVVSK
jgi:peptidyl-prolyl cis-trans isomerase B (cyclophilin B)